MRTNIIRMRPDNSDLFTFIFFEVLDENGSVSDGEVKFLIFAVDLNKNTSTPLIISSLMGSKYSILRISRWKHPIYPEMEPKITFSASSPYLHLSISIAVRG